jgi:hypothetical protein
VEEKIMNTILQALLALNTLYDASTLQEYEIALQALEAQVKREFPGFTIAYAVEIGTVGAGDERYQHGGVAHVLLPLGERTK